MVSQTIQDAFFMYSINIADSDNDIFYTQFCIKTGCKNEKIMI